jgi:hypothetical protein
VAAVVLVVLLVAAHLLVVTVAAVPPSRATDTVRPATTYLGPYFAQNWRLFAPNPVSSDRTVRFQGAYEVDGELRTTDWIDWTDVELELVRHRVVGNRAGYVTNKLFEPLESRFRPLSTSQKQLADVADPAAVRSWQWLESDLTKGPGDPLADTRARLYLVYDRAATRLGTEVLEAANPGRTMVAVRYAARSWAVTPWEARHEDAAAREAARPTPAQRVNGWRAPVRGSAAEQASVADFLRRHR